MKNTEKAENICGKCLHHRFVDDEWICNNPDSICYGCYTEYYDRCQDFDERAAKSDFSVTIKKK